MYAATLVFFGFVGMASAAMVDLNCTAGGLLTPNAVACNDKAGPACATLYVAPPAPVMAPGTDAERSGLCFSTTAAAPGGAFDPAMQKAAVASCAKTCGYCCLTPEYKCANAPVPKMNCATITQDMCMSSAWRSQIASECPSACGFCLEGGCVDAVVDCVTQFPAICNDPSMQTFVNQYCQRTCQRCGATTAAPVTTRAAGVTAGPAATTRAAATCVDARPQCASWAANGYCTNAFYSAETIRTTCGRTCGRC